MSEKIPQADVCVFFRRWWRPPQKHFDGSHHRAKAAASSIVPFEPRVEVNLHVGFITWDRRKTWRQTRKMSLSMFQEFPITSVNR